MPRKPNPQTQINYNNSLLLFNKFVKPEKKFQPGRDIKIYKQLIAFKPFEYWQDLDLGFKLNSLAFFLSPDGKEKLIELEKRSQKQKIVSKNKGQIKIVKENVMDENNLPFENKNVDKNKEPDYIRKNKVNNLVKRNLMDFLE